MRLAWLASLVLVIGSCAAPAITPVPSASGASAPPAVTIAIDCGPFSSNLADCLDIVSAAAKVVDPSPEPGTRAEVVRGKIAAVCPDTAGCQELAAASNVAHVTFVSPTGSLSSADVITNPLGAYVGVNPTFGR